jgi:hypothetical protein
LACKVNRFAQQRERLLAATVQRPGAQAQQLDMQAAELFPLRHDIGTRQDLGGTRHSCAAMAEYASATSRSSITLRLPDRPMQRLGLSQSRIDLRAKFAAGFRTEAPRVQAHLVRRLAMRSAAGLVSAHGVHGPQQFQGPVLRASAPAIRAIVR